MCRQNVPHCASLRPYREAASCVRDLSESSSTHLEQQPLEAPQLGLLLRLEVVQVGGVDQVQPQPHIPSIGEVALTLQACKKQGLSKLL